MRKYLRWAVHLARISWKWLKILFNGAPLFFICIGLLFVGIAFINDRWFYDLNDNGIYRSIGTDLPGMLMEVIFFGILISAYNNYRDRKLRIEKLRDEIKVYGEWKDDEAVYRNTNNIKQLNKDGVTRIDLQGCNLKRAHLENAHLEGADLRYAHLEGANLAGAHLEGANLRYSHLEDSYLWSSHFEGADLSYAYFEEAYFLKSCLIGADLIAAHLEGADLRYAHLEGADLRFAELEGVYTLHVYFCRFHLKSIPVFHLGKGTT